MPAAEAKPDLAKMRTSEMVRMLNSTELGEVTIRRRLDRHRDLGGRNVGDAKTMNFVRYTAWLAARVHAQRKDSGEKDRRKGKDDAVRKREVRRAERDLDLPAIKNEARRRKALRDIYYFLPCYFPHWYSGSFTKSRRELISAFREAAWNKVDQAVLAPRGDGKSTIFRGCIFEAVLQGVLRFPLLVGKSLEFAQEQLLNPIKFELENNKLLLEDFPEVCYPIHMLEGGNGKAAMQTVNGERTHMEWGQKHIIFPTIHGSKAAGAIIACRGADQPIRGTNYRGFMRPDLAAIDDPDTEQSAESDPATEKIKRLINQSIGGLAASGERVARVLLGTAINRRCAAWYFTDPEKNPTFKGIRIPLMVKFPDRTDLWDEYMALRKKAGASDPYARVAMKFLLDHWDEMHRGAEMSNNSRHVKRMMPDGEPMQRSPLQAFYDDQADKGPLYVQTELQNDPPEEEEPERIGLDAATIEKRISGYTRRVVPNETKVLTAAFDLGTHKGCNWSVCGWQPSFIGTIVDYGVQNVNNLATLPEKTAIYNALMAWWEDLQANPYCNENGEIVKFNMIMIDSGNWDDVVWEFCRLIGVPFRAFKGCGSRHRQSPFIKGPITRQLDKKGRCIRIPGHQWYQSYQPDHGQWLIMGNTDYWLPFVHQRLAMETFDDEGKLRRGSLSMFNPQRPQQHVAFAHHLIAQYMQTVKTNRGDKLEWVTNSRQNDWLDTMVMNFVAASACGITLRAAEIEHDRKVVATVPRQKKFKPRRPSRGGYASRYRNRY